MEIVYHNPNILDPRVSFILLDWSCRESFHFLQYIHKQTVPRDRYEVIWIEYYSRRPSELKQALDQSLKNGGAPIMDQWIVMDMPDDLYYHKHLMYNVGIVLSSGGIVTICDSDAIVHDNLVETIIGEFERDPAIALHMDEVRNNDRKFYPFNFPPLKEVIGEGAINYKDGTTTGLLDEEDPLHTRNYGACMSAKRTDLIAIGGADEHLDYLGHVCGPYELTFRLQNFHRREVWHPNHLLYHVWHPGQAGDNNYVGPHDGRHMSTTALEAIESGRMFPLKENAAIRSLRLNEGKGRDRLTEMLIDRTCTKGWTHSALTASGNFSFWRQAELLESIDDHNLVRFDNEHYGIPQRLGQVDLTQESQRNHPEVIRGKTSGDVKQAIRALAAQQRQNRFFSFDVSRVNGKTFGQPEMLGRFHNYNVIGHPDGLYGVPQKLNVSLQEVGALAGHKDIVLAQDLDALKCAIAKTSAFQPAVSYPLLFRLLGGNWYDRLVQWKNRIASTPPPPMRHNHFIESYGHHNILEHEGVNYAIPQSLGAVDLRNPEERNRPDILANAMLKRLKADIDYTRSLRPTPIFVQTLDGFNILRYGLQYYAVPQTLGTVDLAQPDQRARPEVVNAMSLDEMKRKLSA